MTSHRPPPGALPTWKRQLPLAVVFAFVIAGLLLLTFVPGTAGYRSGLCVLAAGLVAGALMRSTLPARRIGLLAVRSRLFDVVLMCGAAIAVVVLALSLPPAS